jgi:hypothetical protein
VFLIRTTLALLRAHRCRNDAARADLDLEQDSAAAVAAQSLDGIERELAAVMRRPSNPAFNVNQERLHVCGYVPRSEVSRLRGLSTCFIARPESIRLNQWNLDRTRNQPKRLYVYLSALGKSYPRKRLRSLRGILGQVDPCR